MSEIIKTIFYYLSFAVYFGGIAAIIWDNVKKVLRGREELTSSA